MHEHVLVISHRRSGTHFLIDAMANNFAPYRRSYLTLDRLRPQNRKPMSLDRFRAKLAAAPRVIKSHMHRDVDGYFAGDTKVLPLVKDLLRTAKMMYVYRDGRDVLTSLYFYMRRYQPAIAEVDFSDFIRMENDFDGGTYDGRADRVEFWKSHVESWLTERSVFPISFEQLKQDYPAAIRRLGRILGLEPPESIRHVERTGRAGPAADSKWSERLFKLHRRIFRRVRHTTVIFRRGAIGDYRHSFSPQDLEYFHSVAGDLLARLGYGGGPPLSHNDPRAAGASLANGQ